jgi:hypothetical protein
VEKAGTHTRAQRRLASGAYRRQGVDDGRRRMLSPLPSRHVCWNACDRSATSMLALQQAGAAATSHIRVAHRTSSLGGVVAEISKLWNMVSVSWRSRSARSMGYTDATPSVLLTASSVGDARLSGRLLCRRMGAFGSSKLRAVVHTEHHECVVISDLHRVHDDVRQAGHDNHEETLLESRWSRKCASLSAAPHPVFVR